MTWTCVYGGSSSSSVSAASNAQSRRYISSSGGVGLMAVIVWWRSGTALSSASTFCFRAWMASLRASISRMLTVSRSRISSCVLMCARLLSGVGVLVLIILAATEKLIGAECRRVWASPALFGMDGSNILRSVGSAACAECGRGCSQALAGIFLP